MRPPARLSELPFLAATAAIALTLVLPWFLPGTDHAEETVAISDILPWAVPDPETAPAPMQLARHGATDLSVAQP